METLTQTQNELCTHVDADENRIRITGNLSPIMAGELLDWGNVVNANAAERLFNVSRYEVVEAMDGRHMVAVEIIVRRLRAGGSALQQSDLVELSELMKQDIK